MLPNKLNSNERSIFSLIAYFSPLARQFDVIWGVGKGGGGTSSTSRKPFHEQKKTKQDPAKTTTSFCISWLMLLITHYHGLWNEERIDCEQLCHILKGTTVLRGDFDGWDSPIKVSLNSFVRTILLILRTSHAWYYIFLDFWKFLTN